MTVLIKDIPKEERPRERLILYGAANLSNEELISIILRSGTNQKSVKELSMDILRMSGKIQNLKHLTINKMREIRGISDVKAVTFLAALELGKRVYLENEVQNRISISNAVDVYRLFGKYIYYDNQEKFMAIYLNNQKEYISHKILFVGTVNQSLVHPREVFKEAIRQSASSIIIMHNHPSGNLTPSESDNITTKSICASGNIIGIPVLDHLIVSKDDYYSYEEEGLIIYD